MEMKANRLQLSHKSNHWSSSGCAESISNGDTTWQKEVMAEEMPVILQRLEDGYVWRGELKSLKKTSETQII